MRRCGRFCGRLFLFCCFFMVASLLPARAVEIQITYGDAANEGFNDPTLGAARRNAFEAAAGQWGQKLNGAVPVRINAFFDPLGGSSNSAVLGQAGPESFFENWTGTPSPNIYYAVALANQLADTDLDPGFAHITATFNSDVDNNTVLGNTDFYYGTDLQAGSDIDFYTIALHELCHGLGFLDTVGSNGAYLLSDASIYDVHLANSAASSATLIASLSQSQRAATLISNSLFFSGTNTRAAGSGSNAKIYAPNPYEDGSSVSHLDETTYSPPPDGNAPNANEELMTPFSSVNTHTIGAALSGIMKDLGWGFQGAATPSLSINSISLNEGNGGATNANLTVTLSAASAGTVTVNYATTNGTATSGSDYTAKSGTLSFAPGVTTQIIPISILGDTIVEPNETLFVDLSSPTGATIAQSRGTITIVNDDSVAISINDVAVSEGDSGTTSANVTFSLSAASSNTVTVNYATTNGTATVNSDYVTQNGTVTFSPGQTSRTVSFGISGDTLVEPNETFFVDLSSPVGASITKSRGVVTILNDDSVSININDVSIVEGNSGSKNATLTLTLSAVSAINVTVSYNTTNASATAGSDYIAKSGTVTFTPGVTTQSITVSIIGDTVAEADETFFVDLSSPVGATLADNRGVVTIANDDSPSLSINNVSLNEGNGGATNANLTVTLSTASANTVTVNYATTNGTATAGSDYTTKSGTLSFAPGVTTQIIPISILGDTIVEPNETLFVDLSSPTGATIAQSRGTITIVNDDSATLSIGSASLNETDSATTNAVLTVMLSAASASTVTVNYGTINSSAVAGSDYIAKNATLTFTPGQTSQTISVAVIGDTLVEPNEAFFVDLSSPVGASITQSRGTVTIVNDDVFDPNAPLNVSLTPRAATDAPGAARLFTAVYSDPKGNANISQAMLQLNTSTSGLNGLRCYYAAASNLLFFLNETGTGYSGGFAPGSNNVISNSRGSLDCSQTTVTRSGNDITVAWSVKATTALSGLRLNCFLFVRNKDNLIDNFEAFGNWLITGNVAPVNVSLSPANTTANLGVPQDLTTVYSDANGAQSLSQLLLRVGTPFNDCFQGFYDQLSDKLYLLNDSATTYIGGFAPGSNNVIISQHGTLDCANTVVTRSGNVITIKWRVAITYQPWTGTKQNVWMYARDRGNLQAPFAIKGSWTVGGNAAPLNVSITPDTIVSPLNSQQIVSARYQDSNGANNLSQVILRMGTVLSTGLQAYYDVQANRLYLANDAGTGYIGGFAPGSNNIISNSRGKLDCSKTSTNFAGFDLFMNWSITLSSPSYNNTTQNLFLFCRDVGNLFDNYQQFGTWQIASGSSKKQGANAPLLSSIEADKSAQTATLNFVDALPDAANDASNFAVQVNGFAVNIASLKRNGSSVILQLPKNAMRQGDEVAVAWRNLPGNGSGTVKAE